MLARPRRFPPRPEPESLARAAVGGIRAACTGCGLDLHWAALWDGRTESSWGSEKTKDLRPRLRAESHLRSWRQGHVGGLGGRSPLPRGLGDTGDCPGGVVGSDCRIERRELRAFTVSLKMEITPHLIGLSE